MSILITGGAGYIGSHTVLAFLERGYDIIVLDNYINSSCESLKRVSSLTGYSPAIYEGDVRDRQILDAIFSQHQITHVIHFAGLKSVSESVTNPICYYDNNVVGSLVLIDEMRKRKINNFIFSSSATVYGDPEFIPLNESCRVGGTTNPYGTSKFMVERILLDLTKTAPEFNITILRYFNPVGAHSSGLIGEDPNGIPNNLLPYIAQVAIGKLECLSIFGHDYPTKDGTGVRDYIHVMDLAEGHLAALEAQNNNSKLKIYNLGTGKGYSVLELIDAFEEVSNQKIHFKFVERRPGDIAECWSDPALAKQELQWEAKRDLKEMMSSSWNWQFKNPNGFN